MLRTFFGETELKAVGLDRVWRGLRRGDRRDLYMGASLAALAWLRDNKSSKKELIFRKKLPEGSTLVIQHRKKGDPRIEVIKP